MTQEKLPTSSGASDAPEKNTAQTPKPKRARTTRKTPAKHAEPAPSPLAPDSGKTPPARRGRPPRAAKPVEIPTEATPPRQSVPKTETGAQPDMPHEQAAVQGTAPAVASKPQDKPRQPMRGRRAKRPAQAAAHANPAPAEAVETATPQADAAPKQPVAKPASRGRSRGGKGKAVTKKNPVAETTAAPQPAPVQPETAHPQTESKVETQPESQKDVSAAAQQPSATEASKHSRRGRRGGRRRNKAKAANGAAQQDTAAAAVAETGDDAQPLAPPLHKAPEHTDAHEHATPQETAELPDNEPALDSLDPEEEEDTTPGRGAPRSGKRKMYISVLSGELVEVVLAEDGVVQEYYVEMLHQAKVKGNIYKGVVSNIDANLQAAFVSYAGGVKNGFLQIDEVHPEYYLSPHDASKRKYPFIQKVLKPGQEILVQVVKEPAGTKGAFLTSYLSIPGRFLVLTPGREQIGVSRKVDSDGERTRLRGMLEGLKPGKGLGVIVRTVSEGASKTNLQRDLQFLKRLWKEVRAKGKDAPAPSLIYQELDLSTRAVRDYLTEDINEVWTDDAATAKQVAELAGLLFPKKSNLVQVHKDTSQSMLERFSLQKQLDQIHSREVSLPSGGRLAFDNTEALMAIDINSGRSSGKNNFEDMAYRTNIEAARMIPLQLRLRDIGGQVVVDFIEMRDKGHWREVEKAVAAGMKGDRARYDVGKIGPFGMLEIVRQRLGSSAISISTEPCPCCKGTGIRRNLEWQSMQSLRDINRLLRAAMANNQTTLTYHAETELAFYLLNAKRNILEELERETGIAVAIRPLGA